MCRILSELCSILHLSLGDREDHRSVLTIESSAQELTHELADLFDAEVHHSDYLLPDELFTSIVHCYLSTRLLDSGVTTEIHPDLVCGFSGLWIFFSSDDGADSELYGFEL